MIGENVRNPRIRGHGITITGVQSVSHSIGVFVLCRLNISSANSPDSSQLAKKRRFDAVDASSSSGVSIYHTTQFIENVFTCYYIVMLYRIIILLYVVYFSGVFSYQYHLPWVSFFDLQFSLIFL